MQNFTKPEIVSLLKNHFGTTVFRKIMKDSHGFEKLGRTFDDILSVIEPKLTKDDLLTLVFDYFFTTKHHTFAFETDDKAMGIKNFKATKTLPQNDQFKIVALDFKPTQKEYWGITTATIKAQKYNAQTFEYLGKGKSFEVLIPFKIQITDSKHIKLKIIKYAPSFYQDAGTDYKVLKVSFDENDFAHFVEHSLVPEITNLDFGRTNLTSGLKALVKANRLGTIIATAEDKSGEGKDQRLKNKTSTGIFVESTWFDTHLYKSDNIDKTRWFWFEGNKTPMDTEGLKYHTIDCNKGKFSQDAFNEDDNEALLNEFLKQNN